MKKLTSVFAIIATGIIFSSCKKEEECKGFGKLKLTNNYGSTIFRIVLDGGTSLGSMDPKETKEFNLAAGQHTWQMVKVSGPGNGCGPSGIIVVECKTQAFECGF